MKQPKASNPFSVQTPEGLPAVEAIRLFVDVFTDFYKIIEHGHCMVNGPRGCGKSMMFRFLEPDCQCLEHTCQARDLPFFAVLVSIKNTALNLTDLKRMEDEHANAILNEHFLTLFVAAKVFETITRANVEESVENKESVRSFRIDFVDKLRSVGWADDANELSCDATVADMVCDLKKLCERLYLSVIVYIKLLSFVVGERPVFSGPLCGYIDFLFPVLQKLRTMPFMPKGPIYLLIDDADYLNRVQTLILNSWVSSRTSSSVSIKISTQLKYKTFQTLTGMKIDSPHDYAEVNITDLYTTSHGRYLERVRAIIAKRLEICGIKKTPEDFFPPDAEQAAEIRAIEDRLRADWELSGHGFRPSDDVLRYARPTYIADLKGTRKAGSTYSYAGFTQLVHISSGLIRFFLEPAAVMYGEEQSRSGGVVDAIRPSIQDDVIRKTAEDLMFTEYDKVFLEELEIADDAIHASRLRDKKIHLHNLLRALGGIFHQKLISQDSERKVFSVAFSDTPDPDIIELFRMGIQLGYFQRTTIGNKDGTGRTPLYVLTRRLAPYFTLDPSGFAGYLFVTNDKIREAISNPDAFLRKLKLARVDEYFEERQMKLFD
jgi:hypothetical protein